MNPLNVVAGGKQANPGPEKGDVARYLLSSVEVAKFCGVPREEVLGWIDSGRLKAAYFPIDRYRIDVGDLLAFLHKFQIAL